MQKFLIEYENQFQELRKLVYDFKVSHDTIDDLVFSLLNKIIFSCFRFPKNDYNRILSHMKDHLSKQDFHSLKCEDLQPIIRAFMTFNYSTEEQDLGNDDFIRPDIFSAIYETILDNKLRESAGVFYTKNPEVDFMCKLALSQLLVNHGILNIKDSIMFTFGVIAPQSREKSYQIVQFLQSIKVCDPSCGSGAFLMGIGKLLFHCISSLIDAKDESQIKNIRQQLLLHQLFGFDIDNRAIEVTKIRLLLWSRCLNGLPHDFSLNCQMADSFFYDWNNKTFDIVIGNPPYINQLNIVPEDKERLYQKMTDFWGNNFQKDGNSDYFVYFFYLGVKITAMNGITALVTSRSWLDVDFGHNLQQFMLKHSTVNYLIDNQYYKSFSAAVNTCITILSVNRSIEQNTRVILLKKPYSEYTTQTNLYIFLYNDESIHTEDAQSILVSLSNTKNPWRCYFFHPLITQLLNHPKLVSLDKLCEIQRGITTGGNDFFYLPNRYLNIDSQMENNFVILTPKFATSHNNIPQKLNKQYLLPVIKTSKKISHIVTESPHDFLVCLPSTNLTEDAAAYIRWGESLEKKSKRGKIRNTTIRMQDSPMLQIKKYWYVLQPNIGDIIFFKHIYKRCIAINNTQSKHYINNVLYNLFVKDSKDETLIDCLVAVLNSTLVWMMCEINGQTNLGEGAVVLNLSAVKGLSIPNITQLSTQDRKTLTKLGNALLSRQIDDYYDELGVVEDDTSNKFAVSSVKADRCALDKYIFQNLLDLSPKDVELFYREFITVFSARIAKRKNIVVSNKNNLINSLQNH